MISDYLAHVRLIGRDARLMIATQAIMAFAYVGAYAVLFNLYLLRLGYDAAVIGEINAAARLGFAVCSIPAGFLGVRYGPRPLLIAGELIIVIGLAGAPVGELLPHAWQATWIGWFAFLGFAGASVFFVNSMPYVMSVSTPTERGHLFALLGMVMPLASFAGSLVGGFLPAITCQLLGTVDADPAAYRYPLIGAGALFLLTIPLVMTTHPAADAEAGRNPLQDLRRAPIRRLMAMGLVMLLISVGFGVFQSFFNIYLDDGLSISTGVIGSVTAATQLVGAPALLALPLIIARVGQRGGFLLNRLLMAIAFVPLALFPTLRGATLSMLVLTSTSSVSQQIFQLYSQSVVDPRWRPLMSGVVNTTLGLGWAIIAFLGGHIIEQEGYDVLFLVGGGVTLVTCGIFLAVAPAIAPDTIDGPENAA